MLKALFFLVSMLVSALKERRELALGILVLVSRRSAHAMICPAATATRFSVGVSGLSSFSRLSRGANLAQRALT